MPLSRRRFLGGSAMAAAALALNPGTGRALSSDSETSGLTDDALGAARAAIAAGACPGVAFEVARQGQPLVARQVGLGNIETATPIGDHSIFRIGSLTKQFTAALILRLAAEDRLDLHAPARDYLPFFPPDRPFTLLELANHTAGLHEDEGPACTQATSGPASQVELARAISEQKTLFDFAPGSAWLYSNTNYIVLGAVVEKVTGLPLAEAADRMIFKPLGLDRTAFDASSAVVRGRVDGYSPVDGAPGRFVHPAYIDIAQAGGAGGMRSCADDLCRWHHALFAERLFSRDWVGKMITPGRLRDGRPSGSQRFSPADASYGEVQYGMGLLIPPAVAGRRSVLHYGFINGFASLLESFVDEGLTTAVLCNGDAGPALPFHGIRKAVEKRLHSGSARTAS
jgi:CubicO group peptidase (beta-lactamase class C family)